MNLQFRAQPEIPAKYIHRIQWSVSVVSTQGISSLPVIVLKPLLQLFKPVTLWLSIKTGESHGAFPFSKCQPPSRICLSRVTLQCLQIITSYCFLQSSCCYFQEGHSYRSYPVRTQVTGQLDCSRLRFADIHVHKPLGKCSFRFSGTNIKKIQCSRTYFK